LLIVEKFEPFVVMSLLVGEVGGGTLDVLSFLNLAKNDFFDFPVVEELAIEIPETDRSLIPPPSLFDLPRFEGSPIPTIDTDLGVLVEEEEPCLSVD
jgi:hypothetical protein